MPAGDSHHALELSLLPRMNFKLHHWKTHGLLAGEWLLIVAAFEAAFGFLACPAVAGEPSIAPSPSVDFRHDVQPILAQRCYRCHGPNEAQGGLRLNSRESALAELDSGERAIIPGKPDESILLGRVAATDDLRMPAEGKPLTP